MERVKEVLGYASEKAGCSARHEGAARRDVGGLNATCHDVARGCCTSYIAGAA